MNTSRAAKTFFLAGTAVVVLQMLLPEEVPSEAKHLFIQLVSAFAVYAGLRLHRPSSTAPWWLFIAGLAAYATSNAIRVAAQVTAWDAPLVLSGSLRVAAILCYLSAAAAIMARRFTRRMTDSFLDFGIVLVAGALLGFQILMEPGNFTDDWAITALVALAALAAFAIPLRLVSRGQRSPSSSYMLLIAMSVLAGPVLVSFTDLDTQATTAIGRLGGVLLGAAALHPSMREVTDREPDEDASLARHRVPMLGAALLALPMLTIAQYSHLGAPDRVIVRMSGGVAVLTSLVLWRIARLLTERERLREDLVERERRFRNLVQHAADVIAVIDADLRITYASPAVQRILGQPPERLESVSLLDLVVADDRGHVWDAITAARASDEPSTATARLRTREGEARWIEAVFTNRLDDTAVRGVIANFRDVTDRKRTEQQLSWLALHDGLTGAANRRLLTQRVEAALEGRRSGVLALLFIDLDEFKAVNDTYGHEAGDAVLVTTARRLTAAVKAHDTVARLGGDEFIVLCPGLTDPDEAHAVARRLRAALVQPVAHGDMRTVLDASVGVAVAEPDDDAEALLQRADAAMYEAKRLRRYARPRP